MGIKKFWTATQPVVRRRMDPRPLTPKGLLQTEPWIALPIPYQLADFSFSIVEMQSSSRIFGHSFSWFAISTSCLPVLADHTSTGKISVNFTFSAFDFVYLDQDFDICG